MSLLNLKQEIFGIDISDSSVKIAKLKKEGNELFFESFGNFTIPTDLIINGQIKKSAELAEFLKNIIGQVKGKKINSKFVAVSLPEEKTFLRVVQRPEGDWNSVCDTIKLEAEKHIPVAINEVYLDCSPIGTDNKYALLCAVIKETADSYAQCLEMAGLEPMIFEPKAFSFSRSVVPNNYTDKPILILDLGAKRTNVSIFYFDSVYFSATLNLSANNLTQRIAQELGIVFKEAEQIKQNYGKQASNNDAKIEKVAKEFFDELLAQTRNYINFFNEKAYAGQNGISSILLTGGGANFLGVEKIIQNNLGLTTTIANPWINILPKIPKKLPDISLADSHSYSIALGLAIRGAKFDI
jgi:type IV pilus assembly protein PilM